MLLKLVNKFYMFVRLDRRKVKVLHKGEWHIHSLDSSFHLLLFQTLVSLKIVYKKNYRSDFKVVGGGAESSLKSFR